MLVTASPVTADGQQVMPAGGPWLLGDPFVVGDTMPDPALNVGPVAHGLKPSDLTVVSGDQSIRNGDVPANGLIQGRYFKGYVSTNVSVPLTFIDCIVEGRSFSGTVAPQAAVVVCNGTAGPVNFSYTLIRPVQPIYSQACLQGSALGAVTRCDLSRGEDQLRYSGYPGQTPWFNAQGNYLHAFSFWANDPAYNNGPSHSDGFQCLGSIGGQLIGNLIDARADMTSGNPEWLPANGYLNYETNSCAILTLSSGRHTGLKVWKNWTQGSQSAFQMPTQANGNATGNDWDVWANRFGMPHALGPYSGQYEYQVARTGSAVGPTAANYRENIWNPFDPAVPPELRGRPCTTVFNSSGTLWLGVKAPTRFPGT